MVYYKKLVFLSIAAFFLMGVVFADDDCLLPTSLIPVSSGLRVPYSGALPYSDLMLAYDHLLSYCCNANLYTEKLSSICSKASSGVYLKSPYLFEHLVDVGLRRYDVSGIYTGQTVDNAAQEWYDFLNKSGTKLMTPLLVEAQYKKYRSLTKIPMFQDESSDISTFLPLYANTGFSLRDKYYNLCFTLKLAYENVLQPFSQKWPIQIGNQHIENSYYTKCMNLVYKRVKEEHVIAQTVLLQRSTNTLQQTIESYSVTNFVRDRLWTLYDKFKSVVELWGKIMNQAPLSKRCSK